MKKRKQALNVISDAFREVLDEYLPEWQKPENEWSAGTRTAFQLLDAAERKSCQKVMIALSA